MKLSDLTIAEIGGMKFYERSRVDDYVLRTGIEKNNYEIPENLDGKTVVDIGAFVGGISMLCAKRGATVYAAEPSSENFKIFKGSIALNGYEDRIHAYKVALGNHTGKTRSIDINVSNPASNVLQGLPNGVMYLDHTERVQTKTLKEFFADNKIQSCDILKLDCEGAEMELLDDIVEMSDIIGCIVGELHFSDIKRAFEQRLTMYDMKSLGGSDWSFVKK